MATTQLSPLGTPGRRYSFSPKTAAANEHTGLFTQLHANALPGQRFSFSAKTPETEAGHVGLFTALQPYGVPGQRRTFVAKTEASISIEAAGSPKGGFKRKANIFQQRILQDDEDIIAIIMAAAGAGVFNQ